MFYFACSGLPTWLHFIDKHGNCKSYMRKSAGTKQKEMVPCERNNSSLHQNPELHQQISTILNLPEQ